MYLSDHLIAALIITLCASIGYLWKELQQLIKRSEVHSIRIQHLEQDNVLHKQNYKDLYESLFKMVSELKEDISELKETILKNKHE
jgi:hypothetical protein